MIKKILIICLFYTFVSFAEGDLAAWFHAAKTGNSDVIQKLIGKVDVNAQDNGYTALMYAVFYNHENIVKLLLQVPNININARNNNGWTALMFASKMGNQNIVKLLLNNSDIDVNVNTIDGTALSLAAQYGEEDVVKLLLQVPGIEIDARADYGITALMKASKMSNHNIAKLLLEAGADPNIKSETGKTALDFASVAFMPILEKLIDQINIKPARLLSDLSIALHSLRNANQS